MDGVEGMYCVALIQQLRWQEVRNLRSRAGGVFTPKLNIECDALNNGGGGPNLWRCCGEHGEQGC